MPAGEPAFIAIGVRHDFFFQIVSDPNGNQPQWQPGPVTLFRLYPDGVDAATAYHRELTDRSYRAELERHNAYNRWIFDWTHAQAMQGKGVLLSWTDAYRHTTAGQARIPAIKSFVMSPWTDRHAMDAVVQQVQEARRQRDGQCKA